MPRTYLNELDFSEEENRALIEVARAKKRSRRTKSWSQELAGRHVALYFEKPSVRTRVSFTVAVHELGGRVVELDTPQTKVGKGEDIGDFAAVLGRYVDAIVARVFAHQKLEVMAARAGVPVINALSDARHPCQALADVLTIIERRGRIEGEKIGFIGEGNNVAASLGLLCAQLGAQVVVASPKGYGLPASILAAAQGLSGTLSQVEAPAEAAAGAGALYTDTWVSMGDEGEAKERALIFGEYRIDRALIAKAQTSAIVMHCLPAVRGQEIDAEVMLAPCSAIWDQAENRLHVEKALLCRLLAGGDVASRS